MALTKKQRDQVVETFLNLLADRPYEAVRISDVAEGAKVSLADLYEAFPSRLAIWEAFARRIDHEVLKEGTEDMADEAPRERLFDVMMRRFDALVPFRPQLRRMAEAAGRDPALALALNRIARRSHAWMLAAARIEPGGIESRLLAQGSALTFARVMRVFLEEEDPGMPRTMAELDRRIREGEERFRSIARFTRLLPGSGLSRRAPGRAHRGPEPAPDPAANGAGHPPEPEPPLGA